MAPRPWRSTLVERQSIRIIGIFLRMARESLVFKAFQPVACIAIAGGRQVKIGLVDGFVKGAAGLLSPCIFAVYGLLLGFPARKPLYWMPMRTARFSAFRGRGISPALLF